MHRLASSGKGNITNGKIRFINNKDYDDAVENLSKVVERMSLHRERYEHELEQKAARAKIISKQAFETHNKFLVDHQSESESATNSLIVSMM